MEHRSSTDDVNRIFQSDLPKSYALWSCDQELIRGAGFQPVSTKFGGAGCLKTCPHGLNWQRCGGGYGIHSPDIDEDLSTEGLLRGTPALRDRIVNLKPKKCG